MTPDGDLMRLYGTEVFFQEKNAAGLPSLPMRLLNAIIQQQLAKDGIQQHTDQHDKDEQRNRAIQALVALELAQVNGGLRHTRPPLILGAGRPGQGAVGSDPFSDIAPMMSGGAVPIGLDEGMVRMASQVMGVGTDLAHLDKEAAPSLAGIGNAVSGLGKKLISTVASPKLAPTMAMASKTMGMAALPKTMGMTAPTMAGKTMGMGMTPTTSGAVNPTMMASQASQQAYAALPQQARGALEAHPLVAQHGIPAHIAAQLAGHSAKPGEPLAASVARHAATPISAARPPATPAPTAASLAKPVPSAAPPAISAAPATAPPPTAKPASPGVPVRPAGAPAQPAGTPPASQVKSPYRQPGAPPTPPPSAAPPAQPGTLQRIGNDLGGGKWKYKLPMLAAGAAGTYGAYKGLQKGLEYMSGEAQPRKFNEGAPQLPYGVNEYGHPQLGTPLQ